MINQDIIDKLIFLKELIRRYGARGDNFLRCAVDDIDAISNFINSYKNNFKFGGKWNKELFFKDANKAYRILTKRKNDKENGN